MKKSRSYLHPSCIHAFDLNRKRSLHCKSKRSGNNHESEPLSCNNGFIVMTRWKKCPETKRKIQRDEKLLIEVLMFREGTEWSLPFQGKESCSVFKRLSNIIQGDTHYSGRCTYLKDLNQDSDGYHPKSFGEFPQMDSRNLTTSGDTTRSPSPFRNNNDLKNKGESNPFIAVKYPISNSSNVEQPNRERVLFGVTFCHFDYHDEFTIDNIATGESSPHREYRWIVAHNLLNFIKTSVLQTLDKNIESLSEKLMVEDLVEFQIQQQARDIMWDLPQYFSKDAHA